MTEILTRPQLPTDLMTVEQFEDCYEGKDEWVELVDGRVIEVTPPNPDHGGTDTDLILLWAPYVRARGLGKVYQNSGFIFRRNPDTVLAPDQAFVSRAKLQTFTRPERGYWPVVPDLVVEIVSPGDRAGEVQAKVIRYLNAGVSVIWVVYPKTQEVRVHQPGLPVQVLRREDVLDGGEVLPGLRIELAKLWEE